MTPELITRPVSLTDAEWDLLAGHHSPADDPSGGEALNYSAAMSRLLSDLSGAPEAVPQEPPAGPLKLDAGDRILAHTDGACSHNPGPGGWAAIIEITRDGSGARQGFELRGGARRTTNNQMELAAAIGALEAAPCGAVVEIVTDSKYLADGATKWMAGWVRRS